MCDFVGLGVLMALNVTLHYITAGLSGDAHTHSCRTTIAARWSKALLVDWSQYLALQITPGSKVDSGFHWKPQITSIIISNWLLMSMI